MKHWCIDRMFQYTHPNRNLPTFPENIASHWPENLRNLDRSDGKIRKFLFVGFPTIVIEEHEKGLRESNEKDHVDDAKSEHIIEQHLVDHHNEWTGQSKCHDEKQHVAPAKDRSKGQRSHLSFHVQNAQNIHEVDSSAKQTG